MNVALIGYRGTGKTTVARLLAESLGWNHVDADLELENTIGMSIRDIFERDGEATFREYETQTLRGLVERSHIVIATGGGVVLRTENHQLLARISAVIWLTATQRTILERLRGDTNTSISRPPLTALPQSQEISRLLLERTPLYKQCSQCAVATDDRTPEEITREIADYLVGLGIE